MKYLFFLLSIIGIQKTAIAQDLKYSGEISLEGLGFTSDESPFWLHSNQRGRIDEKTNISTWLNFNTSYQLSSNSHVEAGIGGLFHDGYTSAIQFDESFLTFENSWFTATLGRKQREELYNGLSATNENILWSLNARPMFGLSLSLVKPVPISKSAGIYFSALLEEFVTDDDRYVDNTRVHHKNFKIYYKGIKNLEFSVGLQHFVQWAGTSPVYGDLPSDFKAYMNIFTGREGNDDVGGEEANALGNHLGSYEAKVKMQIQDYNFEVLYNHLFEDGSGRVLANTPDGRYGIFVEDTQKQWFINSVMYELFYTRNQSKNSPTTDGSDNYFNNNLYQSGWTYNSRILGVPFITIDDNRFRVNNNKIIAHHLGIGGELNDLPFKVLASYRKNYGGKTGSFRKSEIFSTYLDVKVYERYLDVNIQLGSDVSSVAAPNIGIGVKLSKKFL